MLTTPYFCNIIAHMSDVNSWSEAPQKETTMRDTLINLGQLIKYIVKKWWFWLPMTLLFAGAFYYKAFKIDPVTYTAKLTFMLNNDGGSSGASSILGMLGGGLSSSYSLDKVTELTKSRKIVSQALFAVAEIDGKRDYLANHIIISEQYHKEWAEKNPQLAKFVFKDGVQDSFTRLENKALLYLYSHIIGNKEQGIEGMLTTEYGELSGILKYTIKTRNEELSAAYLKELYQRLSSFYIMTSTEKQKQTADLVQAKRDSIERALRSKDYAAASFKDKNNGLVFAASAVPGQQMERDRRMMELMYGESVKNAEMTDMALKNQTPFITAIDLPILPIKSSLPNEIVTTITGGIIGLLLSCLILIIVRTYKRVMAEPISVPVT
jgi:uncharacterized protein involved in exopolysaccharide biosynthesis